MQTIGAGMRCIQKTGGVTPFCWGMRLDKKHGLQYEKGGVQLE